MSTAVTVNAGPRRGWKSAGTWIGAIIVGIALFCAVFAPLIVPHDPFAQDLNRRLLVPFWMEGHNPDFILGTDKIDLSALDTDFEHLWIETAGASNSVYVVQTPGEFNINTDLAISVAATTAGALPALDFIF